MTLPGYLLSFSGGVECRPESSRAALATGVQCARQNCLMLLWLADNLSESPNAAIKAEHGIQMLRFFNIGPLVPSCFRKASTRALGFPLDYWGTRGKLSRNALNPIR
jgi:hypothetical protein